MEGVDGKDEVKFDLTPGLFFLVEEKCPDFCYEVYNRAVSEGKKGLVITRDYPNDLRRRYLLQDEQITWLTHLVGEDRINPTSIGILLSMIARFIEHNRHAIVILDGGEYLISQNSFDRILSFVHQVRDLVIINKGIVLMPIDKRVLEEKQLALLERNLEVVEPATRFSNRQLTFELEDGLLKVLKVSER